ncbi:enoyl-CoA hydratase/isomerase family protein [Biscogniauxia marginata]|nr:enoyl-CoA hydratase/isomerase family protein [Biscogniauxia marginata]
MASKELFTIPVPPLPSHQGGSIVCTSPAPQVYLLTWSSPPDNRLTPAFCAALTAALDVIEFGHPPGVVVTTSAIAKFYSNGLDLKLAVGTPGFWEDSLYPLFRRLLTYPMPTVALINGHGFAGGLMLAMHHDYRVFTGGGKGYACVNELEFGAPLLPPMSSIFRIKLAPATYRDLVLEARRFDARAALDAGLVDAVGGLDAALALIAERNLVRKGTTGVYGVLKAEMYRESVALLGARGKDASEPAQWQPAEKKRKAEGLEWFKRWKEGQGEKAKL